MNASWLVTTYFFEQRNDALRRAVPPGASFAENDPDGVADRSVAGLQRLHQPIAEFIRSAVSDNKVPISVAGDCCSSLPVMAGLQSAGLDPVLVWLDAHGDFNTEETSPSGFLGGMPLAMMVGRGDLSFLQALDQRPIPEADVWLIDARDLDPLEELALVSSKVNHIQLDDLAILTFDRPVHLHIDNDIIDSSEVPANFYPVSGGPSLAKTIAACRTFAMRNTLSAISFSGWAGELDGDGKTAEACAELIAALVDAN